VLFQHFDELANICDKTLDISGSFAQLQRAIVTLERNGDLCHLLP